MSGHHRNYYHIIYYVIYLFIVQILGIIRVVIGFIFVQIVF